MIHPSMTMHAALDGELDAAGMIAFEEQLAADPALAADYARAKALREALRARLGTDTAPPALRRRVEALAPSQRPDLVRRDLIAMAASLVVGVGLGASCTALWRTGEAGSEEIDGALVAGHRRALLAAAPIDVASSDRHTVRPWFDARIAVAPPTPDLAAEGFPLEGGRVDVVAGQPAPTLVYRLKGHIISVTALPLTLSRGEGRRAIGGFNVHRWADEHFAYRAVSDADAASLSAFVSAFQRAFPEHE